MNRKIGKAGKFGADYFPLFPAFLFNLPPDELSQRACMFKDSAQRRRFSLCLRVSVVQDCSAYVPRSKGRFHVSFNVRFHRLRMAAPRTDSGAGPIR